MLKLGGFVFNMNIMRLTTFIVIFATLVNGYEIFNYFGFFIFLLPLEKTYVKSVYDLFILFP